MNSLVVNAPSLPAINPRALFAIPGLVVLAALRGWLSTSEKTGSGSYVCWGNRQKSEGTWEKEEEEEADSAPTGRRIKLVGHWPHPGASPALRRPRLDRGQLKASEASSARLRLLGLGLPEAAYGVLTLLRSDRFSPTPSSPAPGCQLCFLTPRLQYSTRPFHSTTHTTNGHT